MKKKPIEKQPSPSYKPSRVAIAIRHLQQQGATVTLHTVPRRLRKLKYNDQLPLAGID